MSIVNFGIVGCGYIAKKAFIPALKKTNKAKLVAVASRYIEKAMAYAKEFNCDAVQGYKHLISRSDINAIYIATPPAKHEQLALLAAEHGKQILCEKPLAHNLKSVENIISCCQKNDVAILEGFMYQFHPQHQAVRDLVNEGEIGDPILYQAKFGFPLLLKDNFRYKRDLGGGALLDAGSYAVHSARHFFGSEPLGNSSILDNNNNEVDVHGTVLLNFGKGKTALLAFGFSNFYRNTYSIWGSIGQITLNRAFTIPAELEPKIILEKHNLRKEITLPPYDQFVGEIETFCYGINDNIMSSLWLEDAIAQAKVLDSILKQIIQN